MCIVLNVHTMRHIFAFSPQLLLRNVFDSTNCIKLTHILTFTTFHTPANLVRDAFTVNLRKGRVCVTIDGNYLKDYSQLLLTHYNESKSGFYNLHGNGLRCFHTFVSATLNSTALAPFHRFNEKCYCSCLSYSKRINCYANVKSGLLPCRQRKSPMANFSTYNTNFDPSFRNHRKCGTINDEELKFDNSEFSDEYYGVAFKVHNLFENDPQKVVELFKDMDHAVLQWSGTVLNVSDEATFLRIFFAVVVFLNFLTKQHFSQLTINLNNIEDAEVCPPTLKQLRLLALASCIPFIGFGFVDNFVMILAGDLFDTTLCVVLGFSTMAAAALGNLISDLLGIGLSSSIERMATSLGFPRSKLTKQQLELSICRSWYYTGSAVGVALGCILGMAPLLFLDTEEAAHRKRLKAQGELFGDVMNEMAKYMRAEKVVLYIVDKEKNHFRTTIGEEELTLPLDAGIPGEAYSKRKLINWHRSHSAITKSDGFLQESPTTKFPTNELSEVAEKSAAQQILGAPVFGVTREVIGVVEVVNPLGKECFTRKDKEFLIAICSHLAMEIEGKHHITNIIGMCRKQVGSRRAKLPESNKNNNAAEDTLTPSLVERPWEDQELVKSK